jgi:hypothetical protein
MNNTELHEAKKITEKLLKFIINSNNEVLDESSITSINVSYNYTSTQVDVTFSVHGDLPVTEYTCTAVITSRERHA